jgi:hypothetical protein
MAEKILTRSMEFVAAIPAAVKRRVEARHELRQELGGIAQDVNVIAKNHKVPPRITKDFQNSGSILDAAITPVKKALGLENKVTGPKAEAPSIAKTLVGKPREIPSIAKTLVGKPKEIPTIAKTSGPTVPNKRGYFKPTFSKPSGP